MRTPADSRRGAFTLIELLTVLAIVGIVAAVLIGSASAARERAALGQARAELALLAQTLEAYKAQLGDYPRTSDPAALLQALVGKSNPAGAPLTGRAWLELARFKTDGGRDPFSDATAVLVDPFGRPYRYAYASGWVPPAFVLYSSGKDGADVAPDLATGDPHYADALNADNLYAGRE